MSADTRLGQGPDFIPNFQTLSPVYRFAYHAKQASQKEFPHLIHQKELGKQMYYKTGISRDALLLKTARLVRQQVDQEADPEREMINRALHLPDIVDLSGFLLASAMAFHKDGALFDNQLQKQPMEMGSFKVVGDMEDHIQTNKGIHIPVASRLRNLIEQKDFVEIMAIVAPQDKIDLYKHAARLIYLILSNDAPGDTPPDGGSGGGGSDRRGPGPDGGCGCARFPWTQKDIEEFRKWFNRPPAAPDIPAETPAVPTKEPTRR